MCIFAHMSPSTLVLTGCLQAGVIQMVLDSLPEIIIFKVEGKLRKVLIAK